MNEEIRRKLHRIIDVLWGGGVTNPITYIEQLSYLIYLKLLDEGESARLLLGDDSSLLFGSNSQEQLTLGLSSDAPTRSEQHSLAAPRGSLFPAQAERFRWSKWRYKSGFELVTFLEEDVFPYMASLVREQPQIAEYFRDARLEIRDPHLLKQVVDELDTITFSRLGTDAKGDVFEYFLTHIDQSGLNGQFRTPRQIRTLMVALTEPDFGDTICDPACGTGGFLIDAVEYIMARYSSNPKEVPIYGEEWLDRRSQSIEEAKAALPTLQTYRKGVPDRIPDWGILERSIFGYDVSRPMMRITVMNLVLHDIAHAAVKRANTLSDLGGLTEDDLRRQYKVILSNPPFAGVLPKDSIRADLPTSTRKSELLFLALMLSSLAPGGRCAVVVPEGLLFGNSGAHIDLRRRLIEEFDLQSVISLPTGIFRPYTGVKTAVLVFRHLVSAPKRDRVWFYEVRADGYDPDRISNGIRPETPDRNDIPDLLTQWQAYKASSFTTPPGPEANTLLPPGVPAPRCWWATTEMIIANGYILAAGRYKPQSASEIVYDRPEDIIRTVARLEEQITDVLNELLNTIEGVR